MKRHEPRTEQEAIEALREDLQELCERYAIRRARVARWEKESM